MVKRSLGAVLFSLACGACAAILGFERLSEDGRIDDAGSEESVLDAPQDTSIDPACLVVGVPERPDAGPADGSVPYLFALSSFDLGIDASAPVPGYNIDLACSTSPATSTCATSADPATFAEYVRDRDRGLDNAGFPLLQFVASINPSQFGPAAIDERLRQGEFGVSIRMTDWNGQADDDSVRIELFPTLRVANADGGTVPAFTSSDVWTRDDRFRVATDATRFISVQAWVRGGTLVAFFSEVAIPVTVSGDDKRFDILLREAWMTARIQGSGPAARLTDGIVAARWRTSDFLGEVRMIRVGPLTVCEPPAREGLYVPAKAKLCSGRDIHAASADDGKATSCSAISIGARFDTYAIDALGPFELEEPFSTRCEDAGVPLGDDCP
jgi:hypothetical protein